jgi:hypothetical protein
LGRLEQWALQTSAIAVMRAVWPVGLADVENSSDFVSEPSVFLAFFRAPLDLPKYYYNDKSLHFNSYISDRQI